MLCLMQEPRVSPAAIFLHASRTPQKCHELVCSSLWDPGRTCLFVQAQWSRKKRSSATARNSKPTNNTKQLEYKQHLIQDQQRTCLELWQGCPSYSTKARYSQPKQSVQPTAHFLTPFTPHEGLRSHAFFSGT